MRDNLGQVVWKETQVEKEKYKHGGERINKQEKG